MQNTKQTKLATLIILSIFLTAMFLPLAQSQLKQTPSTPIKTTDSWWNTQWPYRKLITIDHTKISADLTNFPVLLAWLADPDLTVAQPAGQDLVFVRYDDNITTLHHEIEHFNQMTGQLIAWVNVTTLSSISDTKLWLYFGNPSCGPQQNIPGTWDANYVMVQHLNETCSILPDSTLYNNHGVANGTAFTASGKIDGAHLYNGNDRIVIDNFTHTPSGLTIETWVYRDTTEFMYIACKGTYSYTNDWILYLRNNQTGNQGIDFSVENHSSFIRKGDTPVGCWFYLTATYDSGTAALYLNATEVGNASGWPCIKNNYPHLGLGNDYLGTEGSLYPMTDVRLDEVRISKTARTSSWIDTCFTNQNNPTSFFTVGAQQQNQYTLSIFIDPPCGGTVILSPDPPYHYNDIVSLTAVANPGFTFDHWSGDLTGSQNPTLIIMDDDKSVAATFVLNNTPPVAMNDTIAVLENSTDNTVDVLANDYDPDGDELRIESITQPQHGTATNDDFFAWYTPGPSYTGDDSFTYMITDGNGGNATATVFITVTPLTNNSPPNIPHNPIPMNGQMNVSITPDLYWAGGDPDPGDTVTYDVYFGMNMTPPLVAANLSTTGYDVGVLNYDTTYYWRIVSWDNHNATAAGLLWHFTTEQEATEVNITITRPKEHTLYLRSFKLFSLPRLSLPRTTFIYGPIRITAAATAEEGVDRVEFYIDGKLKHTDKTAPYTYRWAPLRCFKHTITVIAYDLQENMASDEITVFKWRLHPVLLMIGGLLLTN